LNFDIPYIAFSSDRRRLVYPVHPVKSCGAGIPMCLDYFTG